MRIAWSISGASLGKRANVIWNTYGSDRKSKQGFEDRNVIFMTDGTDDVADMIRNVGKA